MRPTKTLGLVTVAASLLACREAPAQQGQAPRSATPVAVAGVVRADTVAQGLGHPWGMEFLPDGRMLVTERPGRLRIVGTDGRLSEPLAGVPEVAAEGQGGLLDVALDPRFAENRFVYLSYAAPGQYGRAGTAVARGRLGERGLEDVKVIWEQTPKVHGGSHFGSRLVFDREGRLYITTGDRHARPRVQELGSSIGKVLRINADGTVPRDNPFTGREGALPEVWSYGHRNAQAAALHPETGELWTIEHGARGGDELNQPKAGRNYGWPVITYGRDYSGMSIGEGSAKEGMEQPVYWWDPVIAPSGMTFYTGDAFRGWKGSILVGGMQVGLVRLTMADGKVSREERYLPGLRVRDVKQGPDGLVYLVVDAPAPNGRIVRVRPAAR
jgi:glucose/arabinose dehydrogenase